MVYSTHLHYPVPYYTAVAGTLYLLSLTQALLSQSECHGHTGHVPLFLASSIVVVCLERLSSPSV